MLCDTNVLLSVSEHSSELSIANHSSWPTVSQLKCVYQSDLRSPTTEDKNLQRHLRSFQFIQKSNQIAFRLTATTSFPRIFFNPAIFKATSKFFGLQDCSGDKLTNRFHVAVRLFSNRSQKTSKCDNNISDTLGYRLVCHPQPAGNFCFLHTYKNPQRL